MRTVTISSRHAGDTNAVQQKLGLTLGCGNCATIRTFVIDETFRTVFWKNSIGFEIKTECEKCGHLIAAAISWIDDSPGYSYRKLDGRLLEGLEIKDDSGLREPV